MPAWSTPALLIMILIKMIRHNDIANDGGGRRTGRGGYKRERGVTFFVEFPRVLLVIIMAKIKLTMIV